MEDLQESEGRDVPMTATRDEASSRRRFLRRTAFGGLMAAPVLGLASQAGADFVGDADEAPRRKAKIEQNFRSILKHEIDHVNILVQRLGNLARPKPTFKNLEAATYEEFVKMSQTFENTDVGALLGTGKYIANRELLALASGFLLVESRQAAFANDTAEALLTFAPQNGSGDPAFDKPITDAEVRSRTSPYIASLNGGPPIDYAFLVSANNDIRIQNFALALEYLGREFYSINVPKFFGND